jgi:hypothetical protein
LLKDRWEDGAVMVVLPDKSKQEHNSRIEKLKTEIELGLPFMVPDLMYKLLWSLSLCINFYGP